MKGQVLDYSVQKNEGVITTESGERFAFTGSEWKGDTQPSRGMWVDFESQQGQAVGIYRAISAGASSQTGGKKKSTITLLSLFLGGLGAHKFYMGSWGWGIVYLLTCWLWIPSLVALVEGIRCILMTDEEFNTKADEFQRKNPGPFSYFW